MRLVPEVESPQSTPMLLRVSSKQLVDLVRNHMAQNQHMGQNEVPPRSAEIAIQVPSGGDYSGMKLEIEEIEIRWVQ